MQKIEIPLLAEDDVECPSQASEIAAGADVRAHMTQEISIEPGTSKLIPTGIRLAMPPGL